MITHLMCLKEWCTCWSATCKLSVGLNLMKMTATEGICKDMLWCFITLSVDSEK